jgi:hypothetical protein
MIIPFNETVPVSRVGNDLFDGGFPSTGKSSLRTQAKVWSIKRYETQTLYAT